MRAVKAAPLLARLGPTSTLAYRHLLDATDDGRTYIDIAHLALDLGLGGGTSDNSPMGRTWHRLHHYGLLFDARDAPGMYDLPIWLEGRHLNRLRPDRTILERRHREALADVTQVHPDH